MSDRGQCREHPDAPVHAKGLCINCYARLRRVEKKRGKAMMPLTNDLQKITLRETDLIEADSKSGLVAKARRMFTEVIFNREFVLALADRYRRRAFENDKVLLDYVKRVLPEDSTKAAVQVNIQTNLLTKPEGVTYDVEGSEIRPDPVDVS